MLEEKIDALIVALEQNTCALMEKPGVGAVKSTKAAEDTKQSTNTKQFGQVSTGETAKQKKAADVKKGKVNVESVKAQAKKIALASDDPKECMNQIREAVSEISELCYEGNANVGIDKFDATGLILIKEELDKFVYTSPEPEKEEAEADDLEI